MLVKTVIIVAGLCLWLYPEPAGGQQIPAGEGIPQSVHAAAAANKARVAENVRELGAGSPLAGATAVYFTVPAISPVKRLPADYPEDGILGGHLRLIAARDEFIPASFMAFAFDNLTGVQLRASPLTGANGEIPAANVDLKIIKVWYQTGGGWHSYFADQTGRKLVPELLLNDETLILVDHDTEDNYLRVDYPDGPKYVWISNPLSVDVPFNTQTEPVADASTLQPFRLDAGAFKQFWVTVKVPATVTPGIYTGNITLTYGSRQLQVPLSVQVLPFELPEPRTYYDLDRNFYTMLYNSPSYGEVLRDNGIDREHADRKMLAVFTNMRAHNILHPRLSDMGQNLFGINYLSAEALTRELELRRQAGLSTDPVFGGIPGIPDYGWLTSPEVRGIPVAEQPPATNLIRRIDTALEVVRKTLGHTNVYCFGWDEPGMAFMLAQRKAWMYVHDQGLKIYSTGQMHHLDAGAYNIDMINIPGPPERQKAEVWHQMGTLVLNYAGPHTGPENPAFNRRTHGLLPYKANYDGVGNYKLDPTKWNDFLGDVHNFRGFQMTYGTRDGVIDTLQWEGTREGLDDVRYATLLQQLARRLNNYEHREARYAARRALLWLERIDENTADPDLIRLEMIEKILGLMAFDKERTQ